jgi:hypothetical protein
MEQVVAPMERAPKSRKTLVAGLLVVFFLAAFAAAFYYLGGAQVVSDVMALAGFGAAPAPVAPAPAPAAPASKPASASAEATSPLQLPEGVDEEFARRMYLEQLESQANIVKLVGDRVSSIAFGRIARNADGTDVVTKVSFRDGTSAQGVLGLAEKQGSLFFVSITGKRVTATGGDADTVAADGDSGLAGDPEAALASRTVDQDVLGTIVEQQLKSQEIFKGIVDGTFTEVTVDGVKKDFGTARLDVTFSGPRGGSVKGRVLCIQKRIDGQDTWFITSFNKV